MMTKFALMAARTLLVAGILTPMAGMLAIIIIRVGSPFVRVSGAMAPAPLQPVIMMAAFLMEAAVVLGVANKILRRMAPDLIDFIRGV